MPVEPSVLDQVYAECRKEPPTGMLNYMLAVRNNHPYKEYMDPQKVFEMVDEVFWKELYKRRSFPFLLTSEVYDRVVELYPMMAKVEGSESLVNDLWYKKLGILYSD